MENSTSLAEAVYTPDAAIRMGVRVWCVMVRDLVAARGLVWRLFVRDLAARYRQSWLGYVWALLPTMLAVFTFWYLSSRRIIPISQTPYPYIPYALWGMGVWQLLLGCYGAAAGALSAGGAMVTKINFPKEVLVFAVIGQALFDFLIRLVPVVAVFAWFKVVPQWTVVFQPLVLLPIVLMAMGAGMIMAVLSTFVSDVAAMVGMALNFGLFLTPVLYPPAQSWPFAALNVVNPVAPVLIASHDLMVRGRLSSPATLGMAALFSVLVFGIGWRFFRLAMPRIAERF